jgi:hypothetical protein
MMTKATITSGTILQNQIISNCASDFFTNLVLEGLRYMWLASCQQVFILIVGMFGFVRNEMRLSEVNNVNLKRHWEIFQWCPYFINFNLGTVTSNQLVTQENIRNGGVSVFEKLQQI